MKCLNLQFATFILLFAGLLFTSCEKENFEPQGPPNTPGDVKNPDAPAAADYRFSLAVKASEYQKVFENFADRGYRPVWIDGFIHRAGNSTQTSNEVLFNVVFVENNPKVSWYAYHGMTSNALWDKIDDMKKQGFILTHLESYRSNDKILYAPIFVKGEVPVWEAVTGKTPQAYQAIFDEKVAEGYRLVNRSIVHLNGKEYVCALFDKKNVGAWVARARLSGPEIQALMEENKSGNKMAAYLDISQETSTKITYGAIFNSEPNKGWYALNGLTQEEATAELTKARGNGYQPTFVVAYDVPGLVNGNEVYNLRFAVGLKK